ncbi:MAG TPA: hypothetical protein VKR22_03705, partial [Acidimicrobiales bacterium]|nr:hypothetical protein [Acidimicrobiales bacterium]
MTVQGESARQVVGPGVEQPTTTDMIKSMAISSAELWHDVLQRLSEVQEGQILIAQAIADLGSVVDSLAAGTLVPGGPALAPVAPMAELPEATAPQALEPEGVVLGAVGAVPVEVEEAVDAPMDAAPPVDVDVDVDEVVLPEPVAAASPAEESTAEPRRRRFRLRRRRRAADDTPEEPAAPSAYAA